MVFLTMAFYQLFNALAIRSDRQSIFTMPPSSNWYLYGAVLIAGLMQILVIYFPPLQGVFKTTAVTGFNLFISLGVASSILWAIEIEKILFPFLARKWRSFREVEQSFEYQKSGQLGITVSSVLLFRLDGITGP